MPSLAEMLQGQKRQPQMPLRLQALMQTNPQAAQAVVAAMAARRKELQDEADAARRSAAQFMGVRG